MARLPHAHPMVLVDRVVALHPGVSITGLKAITASEPCYAGLTAGLPAGRYAYPTSLLLESFGQTAAILWLESVDETTHHEHVLMLIGARDCRIEGEAFPGDTLRHVARLDVATSDGVVVSGETWVGDRRIASIGSMTAAVRPRAAVGAREAYPRHHEETGRR